MTDLRGVSSENEAAKTAENSDYLLVVPPDKLAQIYGVTSQLRPAAVSIAANIAEGCGGGGGSEPAGFLKISTGSASELEYLLVLGRDPGWFSAPVHEGLAARTIGVKRMLASLIRKLTAEI